MFTMNQECSLLFVCYGNICRSPMALGLAKRLLGNNRYIESDGTNAYTGGPASAGAIEVMKETSPSAVKGTLVSYVDQRSIGNKIKRAPNKQLQRMPYRGYLVVPR